MLRRADETATEARKAIIRLGRHLSGRKSALPVRGSTTMCTKSGWTWVPGGISIRNINAQNSDAPPRRSLPYSCLSNDAIIGSRLSGKGRYWAVASAKRHAISFASSLVSITCARTSAVLVDLGRAGSKRLVTSSLKQYPQLV